VSEAATRVHISKQHGITLAECIIDAAKLVSLDSQSLCDAWDLQFVVIQTCLNSAENSLKLYHDML